VNHCFTGEAQCFAIDKHFAAAQVISIDDQKRPERKNQKQIANSE
jgi:hypothetical protein